MKLIHAVRITAFALLALSLLGLNAMATVEKVWDEDSQLFVNTAVPEAPVAPATPLDREAALLWDESHDTDGDDLYGNYSILAGYLPGWGITATQLFTGPITTTVLDDYDILVLIDNETAYTVSEIADIQTWISGGGKLLVIGENSSAFNMASHNELLAIYNIQFVSTSTTNASNFATHPITEGLSYISWAAGSALTVSAPATSIAWDAAMNNGIATNEDGIVLVVIDDSNMMDNTHIILDDNLLCMENTFTWLAGPGGPPRDVFICMTPVSPPIHIPLEGGSFEYNVTLTNNEAGSATFDAWIVATIPGGPEIVALGPINLTLAAGASVTRMRTQYVPGSAPNGWYTYTGNVGYYPSEIADSDFFTFEKGSDGQTGGYVGEWANCGEPFEAGLEVSMPAEFTLLGNFPNPFNPQTTLSFALPNAARVKLAVYDLSGRRVATLVNGFRDAGVHQVTFDGSNLASGVYLYRLQAGDLSASGKMVLMK